MSNKDSETVEVNKKDLDVVLEALNGATEGVVDPSADYEAYENAVGNLSNASNSHIENGDSDNQITIIDEINSIQIAEPESTEDYVQFDVEGSVDNGLGDSVLLTFHHGRPIFYFWQPGSEDAQWAIALPTADDPEIRPTVEAGWETRQTKKS